MLAWIASRMSASVMWVAVGVMVAVVALLSINVVRGKIALNGARRQISVLQTDNAECRARVVTIRGERNRLEAAVATQNDNIERMASSEQDAARQADARAAQASAQNRVPQRNISSGSGLTADTVNQALNDRLQVIGSE